MLTIERQSCKMVKCALQEFQAIVGSVPEKSVSARLLTGCVTLNKIPNFNSLQQVLACPMRMLVCIVPMVF